MKRCPTCDRSYTDDTQKFCLDDGSTLVEGSSSSFDPQATLAMPGAVPTSPPSNPYGSGSGQGSPGSGAGQLPYGSSAGQGSHDAGSGQRQQAGSWSPTPQRFTPVSTAAPKRSILPWVLGGVAVAIVGLIGLIVIIAIAFSGSSNKNTNKSGPANVVIRSPSGKIQVSVPPTWKSTTELNDNADLQVSDPGNELYLIVLTDAKSKYSEMDIDKHSTGTLESLTKNMTYSNKVGPTKLKVDGNPALQYEIRGTTKGINVVYLHTTVETGLNYQQIISWTLQANYSEREDLLKDIINSFKES